MLSNSDVVLEADKQDSAQRLSHSELDTGALHADHLVLDKLSAKIARLEVDLKTLRADYEQLELENKTLYTLLARLKLNIETMLSV